MGRVTEVARGEIGAFLEREWTAENVDRFAAADSRPQWAWREYCVAAYENGEMVGAAVFRVRGGLGHLSNVISTRTRRGQGFGCSLNAARRRGTACSGSPLDLKMNASNSSILFSSRVIDLG
jgi:hypothetical protein